MVTVQFCLDVGNDQCLVEDEIENRFNIFQPKLLENVSHSGAILISNSGQPILRVEDELEYTVQHLCFTAVSKLMNHQTVVIPYFSYYGSLTLEPEFSDKPNFNIAISGDFVPTVLVAHQELLLNLYRCGHRFIKFLKLLRGDSYVDHINLLESHAVIAQQALGY